MNKTLQINFRFSRQIWLTFISVMVVGLMMEGFLHAASLPDDLPPPSIGTDYQRFEVQLGRLDAFVQEYGGVDCIFIGSSLVERGIDPVIFSQVYQQAMGSETAPLCFNFGLGSISTSTLGVVVDLLIEMYEPRLFIIGTQARAYNEPQMLNRSYYVYAAEHALPQNPWMRYMRGDLNVAGWLIEHSELYQTALTTRLMLQRDGRGRAFESLEEEISKTDNGYVVSRGQIVDVTQPVDYENPNSEDRRLLNFFATFDVAPNDVAGLELAVSLHNQPTQIVVVEMPLHASYMAYFPNGQQDYDWFTETVTQVTTEAGVMFWQTVPDWAASLPITAWYDRYHLNRDGAILFTTWLAEQTAQAIHNGQLQSIH